jgi:putative molybdopterin biosynthesis protein
LDRPSRRLALVRKGRGIGTAELARGAGVTRQTIHAIETGAIVPSAAPALRPARALEVSVEELFRPPELPMGLSASIISPTPTPDGQPVQVCQVGGRVVALPVMASPYYIPEADGLVQRARPKQANVAMIAGGERARKRIVMAGCDPAAQLLARMTEKLAGVEIVPAAASSLLALSWLKDGRAHIAGLHLKDPKTGEFNLPFVREELRDEAVLAVTLARWEEGWVVAPR